MTPGVLPARSSVRPGRAALLPVAVGLAALVLAVVASLAIGARPVSLGHVWAALTDPGSLPPDAAADAVVVRDLRIPRTVIGLLAGAALGLAGVVMRGVTRNPVADPGLLGVNAGAALGAVLALAVGGVTGVAGVVTAALLGALAAAGLVALVAASTRRDEGPTLLVVAGAAITAGLTSLTTLVLLSDPDALQLFRFWTVGSLTGRDTGAVAALVPLLALGAAGAFVLARPMDALALGDDVARGLGFRLMPTRVGAVAVVVLLCGSATAMAGPLVFVGLVAAQAARWLGTRHLRLLPAAAVGGATLLLLADTLGRVVAPPGELEAGVVVAAAGAPVLIALVRPGRVS